MSSAIVTCHYRYRRPPRKKRKAIALAVPAIITVASKKRTAAIRIEAPNEAKAISTKPANDDRRSAIVTFRSRKHAALAHLLDLTPEEHKHRGDAADALFREIVRRIGGDERP